MVSIGLSQEYWKLNNFILNRKTNFNKLWFLFDIQQEKIKSNNLQGITLYRLLIEFWKKNACLFDNPPPTPPRLWSVASIKWIDIIAYTRIYQCNFNITTIIFKRLKTIFILVSSKQICLKDWKTILVFFFKTNLNERLIQVEFKRIDLDSETFWWPPPTRAPIMSVFWCNAAFWEIEDIHVYIIILSTCIRRYTALMCWRSRWIWWITWLRSPLQF